MLEHIVTMSQEDRCTAQEQGDIRVIGLTTEDVIAGRMQYCYDNEWRAVCVGWCTVKNGVCR